MCTYWLHSWCYDSDSSVLLWWISISWIHVGDLLVKWTSQSLAVSAFQLVLPLGKVEQLACSSLPALGPCLVWAVGSLFRLFLELGSPMNSGTGWSVSWESKLQLDQCNAGGMGALRSGPRVLLFLVALIASVTISGVSSTFAFLSCLIFLTAARRSISPTLGWGINCWLNQLAHFIGLYAIFPWNSIGLFAPGFCFDPFSDWMVDHNLLLPPLWSAPSRNLSQASCLWIWTTL